MDLIGINHDMEHMPKLIETINRAITRTGNKKIKLGLELTLKRGYMNDFFKKIAYYVEEIVNPDRIKKGKPPISIVYLDSLHGFETSGKLSAEANFGLGDVERKRRIADYTDVVPRTDKMERTIQREKPDIVVVGNGHALQLEKRFKIKATLIGGERTEILARNIKKIKEAYKLKRERAQRKRTRRIK